MGNENSVEPSKIDKLHDSITSSVSTVVTSKIENVSQNTADIDIPSKIDKFHEDMTGYFAGVVNNVVRNEEIPTNDKDHIYEANDEISLIEAEPPPISLEKKVEEIHDNMTKYIAGLVNTNIDYLSKNAENVPSGVEKVHEDVSNFLFTSVSMRANNLSKMFQGTKQKNSTQIFQTQPESQTKTLSKLLIIGDRKVGKSKLLQQFSSGTFTDDYIPTVGADFTRKDVVLNSEIITLQVIEYCCEETVRDTDISLFRGVDVTMLVYDVGNNNSFIHLDKYLNFLQEKTDLKDSRHWIIVANKIDLLPEQREVTKDSAKEFCSKYDVASILETSAKDGAGVTEAFTAVAMIANSKQEKII